MQLFLLVLLRVRGPWSRRALQSPGFIATWWPSILAGQLGRFASSLTARTFLRLSKIDEPGKWPRQSCAKSHVHTESERTFP
jgi:hypothetical protein